jgi:hypothetical protein
VISHLRSVRKLRTPSIGRLGRFDLRDGAKGGYPPA